MACLIPIASADDPRIEFYRDIRDLSLTGTPIEKTYTNTGANFSVCISPGDIQYIVSQTTHLHPPQNASV